MGLDLNRVGIIDTESSDLLANMLTYKEFPYKLKEDAKLWCVVVTNALTKEYEVAVKEEITKEWLCEVLSKYDVIVGHNSHKFDLRTLWLFGVLDYHIGYLNESDRVFGRDVWLIDSIIWSRLFNPDRFGGHSLSAWGKRLSNYKDDFRQKCIDAGIISKDSPKGAEFKVYSEIMKSYCIQDTMVNVDLFIELLAEYESYPGWTQASKMEHKLADLALNRETLGFKFDKELAIKCLEDLTTRIEEIADKINPILPPKRMTKGEEKFYTPPANQLTQKNELTAHMRNFLTRIGSKAEKVGDDYYFVYKNNTIKIPFDKPLETHTTATIDNFDHVKMFLMEEGGWEPTEWRIRDLTKDSKKQKITLEQSIKALDKWYVETMEGKYTAGRMRELGYKEGEHEKMYHNLRKALDEGKFSVIIPTSPSVRVGVEKELCPNLVALGDKVWFAKDFALFLTYRHRRSSIAGGDIEDMDFDVDYPNSGFLSMYREEDGRVPTPAIEIGANSHRYRHLGICNIARPTSIYGKEIRSLFGCGENSVFFGFDYASIEARIMAHYVFSYSGGEELGKTFIAEKPNDLHTKMGQVMGIPRSEAKSVNYGIIYGASWSKIKKMTGRNEEESKNIVNNFWNTAVALKEFRDKVMEYWTNTGKLYVPAIDGRRISVRSPHSILNSLFQSAAVIYAKYIAVMLMEKLENRHNLCISPFEGCPSVCSMIEYHDEEALKVDPQLLTFELFETEEEAISFSNSWKGEQLSAIGHSHKGYYICKPSCISEVITESMRDLEKTLKLKVPMGFEFMVGKTWFDCH